MVVVELKVTDLPNGRPQFAPGVVVLIICKLYTTGYLDILDEDELGTVSSHVCCDFLKECWAMSSCVCGKQNWVFFMGS